MSEVPKIAKLLSDPDPERRVAAAVVLGSLKAKAPPVKEGLLKLLESGGPDERRVALDALGNLQVKATLPKLVVHLTEKNGDVRLAAQRAVVAFGESAVAEIEKQRQAHDEEGKRALDAALARLGGKDAFSALLEGLVQGTAESGQKAALEVRRHVRDADKSERKSYLGQVQKFLKRKDVRAVPTAMATGIKILGYLEDPKAIPVLVEHLTAGDHDETVLQEAIIALRFAMGQERDQPEVALALLDVVADAGRDLASAAIDTLTNLNVPEKGNAKLAAIADGAHPQRARFAIEKLRLSDDAAAKKALLKVLLDAPIERADMAAEALQGEKRAAAPLLKALEDPEALNDHAPRAVIALKVLHSLAEELTAGQKKKLVDVTVAMVEAGTPGYESAVKAARAAASDGLHDALRDLAAKLRKRKKSDKAAAVLSLLERGGEATPEDRFRLAMIELSKSRKDTKPNSRARDPSLRYFQELIDDKVDVGALMKKERSLENEDRFYLGWHFIEKGEPLGEELLEELIKKSPRTKLARMARNKLKLEAEG